MPREGYVDSKQDLIDYSNWIYEQTDDWRNVNSSDFRDELSEIEIDEALDEARKLMKEIMDEYEIQGSPNDVHDIISPSSMADPFQRFLSCLREDKQDNYFWQMWSHANKELWIKPSEVRELGLSVEMENKPIGYSNKLLRTSLLKNTALMQHIYSGMPEPVRWSLNPIKQGMGEGEKTVYIGAAKVAEIDAVSKVPWIPPSLQSHEFASQAFNGSLQANDKWQRLVSLKRLEDIRNFARSSQNYMFNPVLLYVNQNHGSIEFDENTRELTVDFKFLKEKSNLFYDFFCRKI